MQTSTLCPHQQVRRRRAPLLQELGPAAAATRVHGAHRPRGEGCFGAKFQGAVVGLREEEFGEFRV